MRPIAILDDEDDGWTFLKIFCGNCSFVVDKLSGRQMDNKLLYDIIDIVILYYRNIII